MLTVNINLNVPAMPENDVWFLNAQAWTNYWRNAAGVATLNAIVTTVYTEIAYTGDDYAYITIDGTNYVLVTSAQFINIKERLDALNNMFKTMRQQLKDAGLITEAQ